MDIGPGSRFNHYELLSQLGKGGMGEVYLAEDTRLRRKVALKFLPEQFTADADRLRRFEQEALATSALNHPNIITIHEIGTVNSTHYITTEFIEGETLRERMDQVHLPLTAALEIIIQSGNALSAAHQAGIIHRDIKPENIMLRRDGYVKVLDFGIAKLSENEAPAVSDSEAPTLVQSSTDPGMVIGTASYMSPEQARGAKVDARSDVFSLGVVLYEMVTGCRPFAGATPIETIASLLHSEPIPVKQHVPSAPFELQRIVSKAMRKDRADRYQTVRDFIQDLQTLKRELELQSHLLPGRLSSETRTMSSAEYLLGEIRQHKRGVLLALTGVVLLALVTGYFFSRRGPVDSVAVLPLGVKEGDTGRIYDTVTGTLIDSLRKYSGVTVSARGEVNEARAVFQNDVQSIAKNLAVRAALTLEVKKDGEKQILRLELSDTNARSYLWGKDYEWQAAQWEVIPLQICRDLFESAPIKFHPEQKQRLEAALANAIGRTAWRERSRSSLKRARESFEDAIQKWPDYAAAYAGLADCYNMLVVYGELSAEEGFPKAVEFADKALSLNPQLAEAHAAKGYYYYLTWDWKKAEEALLKALNYDDKYSPAHQWYGSILAQTHNFEEAMRQAQIAKDLEPNSAVVSSHLSWLSYLGGDYQRAIQAAKETLQRDPTSYIAHRYLGLAYLGLALKGERNKFDDALAELKLAHERSRGVLLTQSDIGFAYAAQGNRVEAERILKEIEAKAPQNPYYLALLHTGLGNKDQAFELLFKGSDKHAERIPSVISDIRFSTLWDDPRFKELIMHIEAGE
ncbi:MAG: protein kinase [Blastocatellia bacterium]|nr:protein kinase [Blastocatellia bacterium]